MESCGGANTPLILAPPFFSRIEFGWEFRILPVQGAGAREWQSPQEVGRAQPLLASHLVSRSASEPGLRLLGERPSRISGPTGCARPTPPNLQPRVRPLNLRVAEFIRTNPPIDMPDAQVTRSLDILEISLASPRRDHAP